MNVGLAEEAAFQLCREVGGLTEYIDTLRDNELNYVQAVIVANAIEELVKIDRLLEEALSAPDPKPKKKFWQFWK